MTRKTTGGVQEEKADSAHLGRFYGALARLTGTAGGRASHRRKALGMIEEVSARLHRVSARRAGKVDLNSTDLQVLTLLEVGSADHVLKAAEIQQALGFTPGGVTRRLDNLAARGLIERLPDPTDGRAWLVRLTPHGQETIRIPLSINVRRNQRIEQAFTAEEWETLTAGLERLVAALGED